MQTPSVQLFVSALCAWLLGVAPATAGLKAEVLNADDPIRGEAPIPLRVKFTNDSARVVEGRLETTIRHDDTAVVIHRSHDLALGQGATTVQLLLPPTSRIRGSGAQRTAALRFLGREGVVELGVAPLAGEPIRALFVIAYVNPEKPKYRDRAFMARLRMENFFAGVETATVWMEPGDLAAEAFSYCAYDFVVFTPEGLASARARQLAALARWVDGGGRLLVYVDGKLGETQREFLGNLTRDEAISPMLFAPDGAVAALPDIGIELRPGLGAAAIAPIPKLKTDATAASPDGGDLPPPASAVEGEPMPHVGIPPEAREKLEGARSSGNRRTYFPTEKEYGTFNLSGVYANLLPGAPRPIPIRKVLVLMAVFIIIVVPCDYYFLGLLRKKRWTWVIFPLAATGAGAWMMNVANRHMNSFEQSGTLRIVELGYDGRVLRESKFTTTLPAATRSGAVAADGAVTLPIEKPFEDFSGAGLVEHGTQPLAVVEGQLSGASTLYVDYQQWTPCFRRAFSLHNRPDDSGLRWDRWDAESNSQSQLLERASAIAPSPGWVFAIRKSDFMRRDETLRSNEYFHLLTMSAREGSRYQGHSWLAAPTGTPKLSDFQFPTPVKGVIHILAYRRDGNDITIVRKLHREKEGDRNE